VQVILRALVIVVALVSVARADKIVAASALKAYKGPEGQIIATVEINDSKEMLVHFRNVDPALDGKTLRYLLEVTRDGQTVYINKKRGSKTYRSIMLTGGGGRWDFINPIKPTMQFGVAYSESATASFKLEDVVNAYRP
jgi:hypothetical protein